MSLWDVDSELANVTVCLREEEKICAEVFEKVYFFWEGTVGDNEVIVSFQYLCL